MDDKRIAEIRLDADQEAEGLEPGYWQDTIFELCDALDAARADVARLREGIIAVAKHLDSGIALGLSHNYSLVAAQQLEDLAATEAQP